MACACKVNSDLTYLQRKYGIGGPKQKNSNISGNLINYIKDILVKVAVICLSPVLFLHIIYLAITGNWTIKLSRLLGMKKLERNVRRKE